MQLQNLVETVREQLADPRRMSHGNIRLVAVQLRALHVVSAFVADTQITLGQLAVPEKTNEITAIPELLDAIDVSGAIVTADAMACQKKIVEKICKKKGRLCHWS